MTEACFPPSALALLVPIAAAVVAGFGLLYRTGVRSQESEVAYLRTQLTEANGRLRQGIPALDDAETEIRMRAERRRR